MEDKQGDFKNETIRIFKYLSVGVVNTIVGLGSSLCLFNIFDFDKNLATVLGTIVGVINSYLLNSKFTFNKKKYSFLIAMKFIVTALVVYVLSYPSFFAFFSLIKFYTVLNHKLLDNLSIIVASVLYTVLGYVANRYFVFKVEK